MTQEGELDPSHLTHLVNPFAGDCSHSSVVCPDLFRLHGNRLSDKTYLMRLGPQVRIYWAYKRG